MTHPIMNIFVAKQVILHRIHSCHTQRFVGFSYATEWLENELLMDKYSILGNSIVLSPVNFSFYQPAFRINSPEVNWSD